MPNYTITPFITGYSSTSIGKYLYHHSTHAYYDTKGDIDLPVTIFLVQGNGHNILIDTGMSNTEIADKYHHPGSYQPEGFAVNQQLEKIGMSCDDIDTIIFTHLHWDHVYYLPLFKKAKLYVQKDEYEFAIKPIPLYYKSYEYPVLGLTPQFAGRQFELLEGECEVLPGISVYRSTGHSVGHQTVTVNTKDGVYHCCGDVIFTSDNLKAIPELHYDITPPGRFLNIVDSWNSIVDLKRRVKSTEFVLATHIKGMIELVNSGRIIGK